MELPMDIHETQSRDSGETSAGSELILFVPRMTGIFPAYALDRELATTNGPQ